MVLPMIVEKMISLEIMEDVVREDTTNVLTSIVENA
jgi:hypothetical protein